MILDEAYFDYDSNDIAAYTPKGGPVAGEFAAFEEIPTRVLPGELQVVD